MASLKRIGFRNSNSGGSSPDKEVPKTIFWIAVAKLHNPGQSPPMNESPLVKPWLRQFLAVLLLGACLIALFRLSPQLVRSKTVQDFVEYWTAGRLNLAGADPYSPEQFVPLATTGSPAAWRPVMMWNPPWILPLVMPFGALDYSFSRVLWLISQAAIVLLSASFIWRFYQGPLALSWVAWLIAVTFLPTLFMLQAGQVSAVMLLGVVLFMMFTQRQVWWLASLSMLLISIKPHTLYLIILAYLVWAISQRRWSLIAGSGIGICLFTCIALLFNPLVLTQYLYAIKHHPPTYWVTPTIGGMLRYFLGGEKVWLQFVPSALGVTWFCFHWWKERVTWKWPEQMPLLLMVSVLTTSYGWTFDYVVLIPVILSVATAVYQQGLSPATLLAIGLYLAIEVVTLAVHWRFQDYFAFVWLVPALAGWYFLMVRLGVDRPRSSEWR